MPFVSTGAFNGYIAKATGQLIAYARDPKRYKVAKYTQLVPADAELFLYYEIHPDDFVRHHNDYGSVWQDGAKRPEKTGQRIRHRTREGQTIRHDYDFQIGWKTLKRADYNVLLANTRAAENECMIAWTTEVLDIAETASNWSGNTADAADLAGGAMFDQGTPENPVIKKTLGELAERITLNTNGVAGDFENADDVGLLLVVSPHQARRMGSCPEIHAIYKESLHAKALVGQQAVNPNAVFQLPEYLYGWKVIVETAVRVSERPQADADLASTSGSPAPRRFCKNNTSIIVCSRPGGVTGEIGAPNYSTLQRYHVGGEMELKVFDEAKHEYTDGHVVRESVTKLAAPATGFLITNAFAPE